MHAPPYIVSSLLCTINGTINPAKPRPDQDNLGSPEAKEHSDNGVPAWTRANVCERCVFNLLEYKNPATDCSPLLPHPTNHFAFGIPLPSAKLFTATTHLST